MRSKLFNLILGMVIGVLMVPGVVMAEVKKIGDVVYTTQENSIYDYLCDDLAGHEVSVGVYEDNKLLVYDHSDGKQYLVDLEKEASCTEIIPEYTDDDFYIEYVWDLQNRLYLEVIDSDYDTYFIKTSDTEVDGTKNYYVSVVEEGNGWSTQYFELVSNPSNDDIDGYLERFFFEVADGEFVLGKDYYKLVDGKTRIVELVEGLDDATYNNGEYFILGENIKRELLAEFSSDEFLMPKEKSGIENDITFTSDDFMYHFLLGGKKYFVFNYWNDALDFVASGVFNEKGEYETFGYDTFYLKDAMMSDTGYVSIVAEINGKNTLLVYDKDMNLVLSEETEVDYAYIIMSNDEVEYIVKYYEDDGVVLLKVNKYYLMTEGELKYNNSDLVIKFSGDLDNLTSVKVNDVELDKSNYTVMSGSTIVTLKNDYLKSLKDGTYILRIEYEDGGYIETSFVVGTTSNIENPDTFDGGLSYLVMAVISLVGIVAISIIAFRKISDKD